MNPPLILDPCVTFAQMSPPHCYFLGLIFNFPFLTLNHYLNKSLTFFVHMAAPLYASCARFQNPLRPRDTVECTSTLGFMQIRLFQLTRTGLGTDFQRIIRTVGCLNEVRVKKRIGLSLVSQMWV